MDCLLVELEKMGCDIQGGLRRFRGNEKMYLKFLYRFPKEETFARVQEAFAQENYEDVQRELHTLKGIAGNLGLTALYELSTQSMEMIRRGEYSKASLSVQVLQLAELELTKVIRDASDTMKK